MASGLGAGGGQSEGCLMEQREGHIAIIGGGTAGWLAALVLQKAFDRKKNFGAGQSVPRISVIESPDIPTVGVGEGSTSIFRQILQDLNIDEAEFLRETGATFKFGIHHRNWTKNGTGYFGPIDDPHALVHPPAGAVGPWLHTARIAAGRTIEDAHLFTYLMRGRKSPFARKENGEMIAVSAFHHAYHFDQARLGRFLSQKANSIKHIRAEVEDIERDAQTGLIRALVLKDQAPLAVNLVLDCTGFRRAVIGRMGSSWHSYADILPLNKAMPFWLNHDPETDIAPYTIADARSAGWMWNIPTADRIGCGYVFSDMHQSPEDAKAEVENLLGRPVEPRGLIPINPGRQEKAWVGNCVSIGLSQSFLEPLEATSIHGTLVQLLLLTQTAPTDLITGGTDRDRERYNHTVAQQVDDFAHFINLHYAGGRTDTPFWKEMTGSGISDIVKDRLARWQTETVRRQHFPRFPAALPHVEEQLHVPVLAGLGLLPREPAKQEMSKSPAIRAHARKTLERLVPQFRSASRKAVGHRDYLAHCCRSDGINQKAF